MTLLRPGGWAARLSTLTLVVILALVAGWIALNTRYAETPRSAEDPGVGFGLFAIALGVLFAVVGGLIVRRHSRNAVGWIFCAMGFVYVEGIVLMDYLWVSRSENLDWPLIKSLAWFGDATFQSPAIFGFFVFFFLLFPDGRLPSPRWRKLAYLAAASIAGLFVNTAFRADVLNTIPIQNPLGVAAMDPIRQVLDMASFSGLVVSLVASVASLVVRLRRSRGDERQQIKWFLAAAAALTFIIAIAPFTFFTPLFPEWAWPVALLGSLSLIPIAAGVAILKYRLYEIDVIINRTLVYVALTAMLASAYLGIVVVLQRVLAPLTADSDIAIAGSTLAVAALFRPARARVQSFIDQRFYRRKYDAAATLAAFSTHLRDQLDLESLSKELVAVVGTTMQPVHASLWLRSEVSR